MWNYGPQITVTLIWVSCFAVCIISRTFGTSEEEDGANRVRKKKGEQLNDVARIRK